ncbi:MAG: C45 family peptidase [Acidimicrobiia bacterium]|nr:C45 family peptidase [Acidimicrobiia bacterium]
MSGELLVVEASGSPRERGRAHGEEAREPVHTVIGRWHDDIALDIGRGVDGYLDAFLAATDFATAVRRWTPDLLDEVGGIAEGAGLSESVCMAWQLLDEEWWYRERHLGHGSAAERCSSAGGSRGGTGTVIAQNMDIEAFHDGSQVLLRSRPEGNTPDSLVLTTAGMIGLTGLNSSGVGVCVNTLAQLAPSPSGLPVAFVIRGLLACRSLAAASEFLEAVVHASGQNYLVGAPEGLLDRECSARQIRSVEPAAHRIVHTNHPLANDDVATDRPEVRAATQRTQRPPSTTRERYDVLAAGVVGREDPLTVARLQEILSDRSAPVSVVPSGEGDFMTFASVIMELAEDPVLHLAPGPPDRTEYEAHTFA